jgi:phosphorylase kinase alpha/beta subunit
MKNKPIWEIMDAYRCTEGYYGKCQLLGYILKREGPQYQLETEGKSVLEVLLRLNDQAGVLRIWGAVRYASSLLSQLVDSISPYITTILVNGKQARRN